MAGWSLARWLGDDGAGEFDQGTVAFNFALPAGAKTAKAIVPTVGPLDYPAPRLAPNVADERRLRYPCLRILLTISLGGTPAPRWNSRSRACTEPRRRAC